MKFEGLPASLSQCDFRSDSNAFPDESRALLNAPGEASPGLDGLVQLEFLSKLGSYEITPHDRIQNLFKPAEKYPHPRD